jgi:hypothetical protein
MSAFLARQAPGSLVKERAMTHHEGRKVTLTIPFPLADLVASYRESEVAKHVRGIRRELLLTLRSLIDARIEALSEEERAKGEKAEAAKKVDVK